MRPVLALTHDQAYKTATADVTPTGWTTLIDWKNQEDDELVRSVSIETTEQWKKLGQARNLYLEYIFANDASRDQNPLASYGAENVEKLKQIAEKYDATRLFQTQQNGGFLLSKI